MWPTTRPSISITLFVVELSLLSRAHRRSKLVRSSNSGEVNAAIRIASRSLECSKSTPRSRSSISRRTSCPEPSGTAVNATCRNSGDIADHWRRQRLPKLTSVDRPEAEWNDVPDEALRRWREMFSQSRDGLDVLGECPVCSHETLHRWFHIHRAEPTEAHGASWAGVGSQWQWCAD